MKTSIISAFRNAPKVTSCTTWAVLFFFTWAQAEPALGTVKEDVESLQRGPSGTAAQAGSRDLYDSLQARLRAIKQRSIVAKKNHQAASFEDDRAQFKELQRQFNDDHQRAIDMLSADSAHNQNFQFPQVIKQRHAVAQATVEKESVYLQAQLQQMATATDRNLPQLAQQLQTHLTALQPKRVDKFDPGNLPFRIADGKVRKPKTTQKELNEILNPGVINAVPGTPTVAVPSPERHDTVGDEEWLKIRDAARYGERYRQEGGPIRVATSGSLAGMVTSVASLPPTAADLAPGEDVQITPAIQALATQLNNNPVAISNWVHDNIEFEPTYGSIQGSDMTLQAKKGNAFDTSSLLIALLRASGIPARYAYGTIDVPSDKLMNWIGGVNDPNAALQLLGQGGIPSTGLAQGGTIVAVQMEHVWVEAYTDFYPGRGTKSGAGNGWVPVDASFKQYEDTAGLDLKDNIAFDRTALNTQLQQSATIDNSAGTLSAINTTSMNNAVAALQTSVSNYITQNATTLSLPAILGTRQIISVPRPVLAASVPFHVVAVRSVSSSLNASLRATATIQFSASSLDQEQGNAYFSYSVSLPQLASKQLTLSFDPATPSDTNALVSYFNAQSTSVPAYQINVVGTLRLNGATVAAGPSMTLGTDTWLSVQYSFPDGTTYLGGHDTVAGDYVAMVPKYSKVPSSLIAALGQQAQAVQTQLQSQNAANLTKDDITGLYLYTAGLGYWAQQDLMASTIAQTMGVRRYNKAALGFFSWDSRVTYNFGVPLQATSGGMSTDIKINTSLDADPNNQPAKAAQWAMGAGMIGSFLEGSHWQLALNHQATPTAGFSSAQILNMAAQMGQTLYQITQQNLSTALANLQVDPSILSAITDAVNQGFTVTIPANSITSGTWTGTGMVILDPQTGSGDYKISGGFNGGGTSCQCFGFSPTQEFLIGLLLTVVGLVEAFAIAAAIIGIIVSLVDLFETFCDLDHLQCLGDIGGALKGFATTMFVVGVIAGLAALSGFALLGLFGLYILLVSLVVGVIIGWIAELAAYLNEHNGSCTPSGA